MKGTKYKNSEHLEFNYRKKNYEKEDTIVVQLRQSHERTNSQSISLTQSIKDSELRNFQQLEDQYTNILEASPKDSYSRNEQYHSRRNSNDRYQEKQRLSLDSKNQASFSKNDINLPHIQRFSRQQNSGVLSKISSQLNEAKRQDFAYKKRVLDMHKIISNLEQSDNLTRKASLENTLLFQKNGLILQPQSQSYKVLPNLYSPTSQTNQQPQVQNGGSSLQSQAHSRKSILLSSLVTPYSPTALKNQINQVNKRTHDLRLVFEGIKKIKYDVGKESNKDEKFFLSQEGFNTKAHKKFQQIFKKVNQIKNQPQFGNPNASKLDGSMDRYESEFEEIKKYLVRTNQILVTVMEAKTPVKPMIRMGLFKLKAVQNNIVPTPEQQTFLMDSFIKEINEYFNKTDKVQNFRHFITIHGLLIQNYQEIHPELVMLYVSQICSMQNELFSDHRFKIKQLIKHMNTVIEKSKEDEIQHKLNTSIQKSTLTVTSPKQLSRKFSIKKVSYDYIQKQASELIKDQRARKANISPMGSEGEESVLSNRVIRVAKKSQKSFQKKDQLGLVLKEMEQEDDEFKQVEKIVKRQSKTNQLAVEEIVSKNNELENQMADATTHILSEPLNHLIDDGGIQIIDAKLSFNSPLADLRQESAAFDESIRKLNWQLDHHLNVITEKQVQDSIREIQERTEQQIFDKLRSEQQKANEKKFEEQISKQRNLQKNRKVQDLINILQRYLKEREAKVKQDKNYTHIQMQNRASDQNRLSQYPQLMQNRRKIPSKWDKMTKNKSPQRTDLSFTNTMNDSKSVSGSIIISSKGAFQQSQMTKNSINFVEKNIINTTELNKNVFSRFGASFDKNIPILEQRSGFKRAEIIQIFSKFKALCEMTMNELKEQGKDLSQVKGVSFEKFKLSLPELKFETEKFAKRVFDQCNGGSQEEYLDWEHFLLAVKAIQARNIDHKIDLFFKIIDQDGNGTLSYDEVFEICANSFEKFSPNIEEDYYMRTLTEFFTNVIFRAVGRELDDEIPLIEIKQAIENKLPDSDFLCLFCNATAEKEDEKEIVKRY